MAEELGLETGNERKDESSRGERRVMFVDVLTLSPLTCWACRGQCISSNSWLILIELRIFFSVLTVINSIILF